MESQVLKQHLKLVDGEAVQMVRDFMVEPEGHMRHPKRFSNSIIMSLGILRTTPPLLQLVDVTISIWIPHSDH